jgi:TonB family protein
MSESQIWSNVISWAVQIMLLTGIGAALPVLLRLKSPGARLLYWQLLLVACVALPWVRPWRSEVIAVSSTPFAAIHAGTQIAMTAPPSPSMPPLPAIALWILAAGVAVRLGWLAVGLLKLARYRRHGRPIPLPPEWTGAGRNTRLLLSDEVSGPVTFGFIRPVVLLPASFPSMSEAMSGAILFHELTHVERRDWLFTLAEELVRAAFWFHPAIWWVLGEIQLAREQTVDRAVIEMTQARDCYVDALLAIAGVTPQLDLGPAPLFLRRRHLKHRVKGIIQEVRMSKKRLVFSQVAAVVAMAAACWFIADVVPLHAQAQTVADAAGVTVNLNGAQLMHRTPVLYPAEALAKGVEGAVVVQVRLDSNGQVVDDAILSGPEGLRKGVQQSVLNWHFDKRVASTVQVVNIDFVKPANAPIATAAPVVPTSVQMASVPGGAATWRTGTAEQQSLEQQYKSLQGQIATLEQDVSQTQDPTKAALLEQLRKRQDEFKQANAQRLPQPAPSNQQADQQKVMGFVQDMLANEHKKLDELRQQQASTPSDQLVRAIQDQEKTVQLMEAKDQLARANLESMRSGNGPIQLPPPSPPIESIVITGLTDSARDQLLAQLPVHIGDPWSAEAEGRISEAARQFDPHLTVNSAGGGRVVRIFVQTDAAPPGAVRIGSNVMAANLINPVKPVYPQLAKMARVQGTVSFAATIGKDGTMEDLKLLSGPPLLVQAAMDAVKQWVYKPTLLNGAPVEVITTIDVNFSLSGGPPPSVQ